MKHHIEQLLGALLLVLVLLGISFYEPPRTADVSTESSSEGTLKPLADTDATVVPQFNPGLVVSTSTLESIFPSFRATSTVIKKKTFPVITIRPPQKSVPKEPVKSAAPVPPPPEKPLTAISPAEPVVAVDTSLPAPLKKTLVNILCTSHKAPLRGTSGSGVLIDSEGIILTVAHVAQAVLVWLRKGDGMAKVTYIDQIL